MGSYIRKAKKLYKTFKKQFIFYSLDVSESFKLRLKILKYK